MKKRIIQITGLLCIAMSIHAQTEVTTGVMHGKDYGVTYMLPKTTIELTIQTTKHTYTPGEFCKYANRYLRLNNIPNEASTYWTLDKVTVTAIGTPDKEQIYFVKLKDKTTAPLMELTEDGIVRSINYPFSGIQPDTPATTPPVAPIKEVDPHSFLTEEILMSNSTAKMAELVAQEIYNIRESKNALVRGEADFMPKDGAQLQIMLDNLTLQEKAMTQMFSGKEVHEPQTITIHLSPEEMDRKVIFRFSRLLGVVESDNLAGEPVYISLKDLNTIEQPTAEEAQENEKKKKTEGVAYNVPGRAKLILSYQDKELFNDDLPITQFGSREYLAPVLFNKNTITKVLFDTITGGLLKVEREE